MQQFVPTPMPGAHQGVRQVSRPAAGAQHKARQTGRTAGTWQASVGVCLQSGRIAGRARWTRSLRTSLGGDVVERTVPEKVVGGRWHAHIQLLNGRAKACERFPSRLVAHDWWRRYCALCDKSTRAAGCGEAQGLMGRDRQLTISALEAGPTLEELELLSIPDSTDSAQEFRDRSTGLPLNPEMVKRAREQESLRSNAWKT